MARVCDIAVAGHSNIDAMTPVAWPATAACRLCLWHEAYVCGMKPMSVA